MCVNCLGIEVTMKNMPRLDGELIPLGVWRKAFDAGAATNLYDGIKNTVKCGISREEAILSVNLNPAKALGCQDEIVAIAIREMEHKQVRIAGVQV